MKRLKSNIDLLKVLKKAKPCLRKAILHSADDEFIRSLLECILNVMNGNVPISKAYRRKLIPFKKSIRRLINRKEPLKNKRKILVQKGGFLGVLLSSLLSGLVGNLLSGSSSSNSSASA